LGNGCSVPQSLENRPVKDIRSAARRIPLCQFPAPPPHGKMPVRRRGFTCMLKNRSRTGWRC
jgi:hypothetical protein